MQAALLHLVKEILLLIAGATTLSVNAGNNQWFKDWRSNKRATSQTYQQQFLQDVKVDLGTQANATIQLQELRLIKV
jgi:hypothetical protein